MGAERLVFFMLVVAALFATKAFFAFSVVLPGHLFIYPDECAYGKLDFSSFEELMDLSVFSLVPGGREGGILFNCFLSSLIVVPVFLAFRASWSERKSAAASVLLVLLFAPLWMYSFSYTTEICLLFVAACAFAVVARGASWKSWELQALAMAAVAVKPLGVVVGLAVLPGLWGLIAAHVLGFAYQAFGHVAGVGSPVDSLRHVILYLCVASAGLVIVPFKAYFKDESSPLSNFVARLFLCSCAVLLAFFLALNPAHFYGRYFDVVALGCLLCAPMASRRDFQLAAVVVVVAFCLWLLYYGNAFNLLDGGLLSFGGPWGVLDALRLAQALPAPGAC